MISLAVAYLHFRRRIPTLFILCSTPERSLDGVEIMQHAVRIAARFRREFQIVYDQAGSTNSYKQRDRDVDWNDLDSVAESSCALAARQKRPPHQGSLSTLGFSLRLSQASICSPR